MTYPVSNLTEKEQRLYSALVEQVMDGDYSAWLEDLVSATSYSQETVIGVLGSLVKKGLVETESRDIHGMSKKDDIFPVVCGKAICFADEDGELDDEGRELAVQIANYFRAA